MGAPLHFQLILQDTKNTANISMLIMLHFLILLLRAGEILVLEYWSYF